MELVWVGVFCRPLQVIDGLGADLKVLLRSKERTIWQIVNQSINKVYDEASTLFRLGLNTQQLKKQCPQCILLLLEQ